MKYAKSSPLPYTNVTNAEKSIKKADLIRFGNTDSALEHMKDSLYEFVLLAIFENYSQSPRKEK